MSLALALFLGLLQGLTEFLPVSSSGHLALFQAWFPQWFPAAAGDSPAQLLFTVLLHLGTLAAVCVYFRRDIAGIGRELGCVVSDLAGGRRSRETPPARRLILLIVAALPPLLPFVFLSGLVEEAMTRPLIVGLCLLATALLLFLADRLPKGSKTERNATLGDALAVGVAQGIAVLPGLSRSGTTITAGLFRKFDRGFAVRFSFLLSLPAVLGATLLELVKALKPAEGAPVGADFPWAPCLAGALVAAVSGYFALGFLKRLVTRGRFGGFVYYCLVAGAAAIVSSFLL